MDEDLEEEMRDHIERRAADLRRSGLSDAEAQRLAARSFGNLTGIHETSREIRLWAALEGTLQDARYAWRGLIRNPVFAVTTIASLGLAIGANTAIYSIIDAALLRPLPVPRSDRLITLATSGDNQAEIPASDGSEIFSYPQYEQLCAAAGDSEMSLILARLRGMGAGLSIDDFGTGSSTLSQLRHLPFDTVKIDRSFLVRHGGTDVDTDGEMVLGSVVGLAHDLKRQVVVEGVESERDVAFLARLGCEFAQGYFFAPALSAGEALTYIARHFDSAAPLPERS